MLDSLIKDIRFALRSLLKSPGFVAIVVLTLALAIGANTAIFSVVDAILFRPLPYPESERLVAVWTDLSRRDGPVREWLGYDDVRDLVRHEELFDAVGAWGGAPATMSGHGDMPESLPAARVSALMLGEVLGVQPALGRGFAADDDMENAPPVILISDGLWRRAFAADPGVVGQSVNLNGDPHVIIGVMPAGFRPPFLPDAALWMTVRLETGSDIGDRGNVYLRAIARLQPEVEIEAARAALATFAQRRTADFPQYEGAGIAVFGLRDDVVQATATGLQVLLGTVAFVLIIACVNIANLLLARGTSRRAEFAVRAALGAQRGRIVRQLLIETGVLAAAGGVFGAMLGWVGTRVLLASAPAGTPRIEEVVVDLRVLAFTAVATLLATFIAGLVPALRTARTDLHDVLKAGGRGADAGTHGRLLRSGLIVVQVALALILLVGAGLLVRSFNALTRVDPGFDPRGVLAVNLSLPGSSYGSADDRNAFATSLEERLGALPGVESASLVSVLPLANRDQDSSFYVDGQPLPTPADRVSAWIRRVTPGYFGTMRIELLSGRDFTTADNRDAALVVIVNETLAQRYFPNESPIGKRLTFGDPTDPEVRWREIIGVARNIRNFGLGADSRMAAYMPYAQVPSGSLYATLRTDGDPGALVPSVRGVVAELDPGLALASVTTMSGLVAGSLATERFLTTLMSSFALVAMTLAVVGLYGVVSYGVGLRRHEMGVRVALGARPGAIRRLVVGSSMVLVGAGAGLGIVGALAATRLLGGLLYGVGATDPLTFAAVVAALVAAGLIAAAIPAQRAARVDPIEVLNRD